MQPESKMHWQLWRNCTSLRLLRYDLFHIPLLFDARGLFFPVGVCELRMFDHLSTLSSQLPVLSDLLTSGSVDRKRVARTIRNCGAEGCCASWSLYHSIAFARSDRFFVLWSHIGERMLIQLIHTSTSGRVRAAAAYGLSIPRLLNPPFLRVGNHCFFCIQVLWMNKILMFCFPFCWLFLVNVGPRIHRRYDVVHCCPSASVSQGNRRRQWYGMIEASSDHRVDLEKLFSEYL